MEKLLVEQEEDGEELTVSRSRSHTTTPSPPLHLVLVDDLNDRTIVRANLSDE
jgi:hypothetical protein